MTRLGTIHTLAACLVLTIAGCSPSSRSSSETDLKAFDFPPSSLPKGVHLAPWSGGSCKMPWMTSNPFHSRDKKVLSEIQDSEDVLRKHDLVEMFQAVYSTGGPQESDGGIGIIVLQFKNPEAAAKVASALRSSSEESRNIAYTAILRGDIVVIIQVPSPGKQPYSEMVDLVKRTLATLRPNQKEVLVAGPSSIPS